MNFKETVINNLSFDLNEMALKHLKDTDIFWKNGDIEKIADKYIENAREDGKDDATIIRGLGRTFRVDNKKFNEKPELYKKEYMPKVKQAIKDKIGHVDFGTNKLNINKRSEFDKLKEFVDKELENKDNSEEVKEFLKIAKKHIEKVNLGALKKQINYIIRGTSKKTKFPDDVTTMAKKVYEKCNIVFKIPTKKSRLGKSIIDEGKEIKDFVTTAAKGDDFHETTKELKRQIKVNKTRIKASDDVNEKEKLETLNNSIKSYISALHSYASSITSKKTKKENTYF